MGIWRGKMISIRVWVRGSSGHLKSYDLKFGKNLDKWSCWDMAMLSSSETK